jgi:NDP-sugar pyrophosphorylase family protein
MASKVTRAVLLAAGQGTRLRPLTIDRPKPMLDIGGRPLIEHSVLQLARYGVREILINLHHCPEIVQDHFGDGHRFGVSIKYSVEEELLGTAGAVKRMAASLSGGPFFVLYGDNLTTCNLDRLVETHVAGAGTTTIGLFWKEDVTPHSAVELQPDDRISRFVEKPKAEEAPSHWISAGINVMQPGILDHIPDDRASDFGFDIFPRLLHEEHRIQGYRMGPTEGLWWIDTLEHYERVRELWKTGAPPI